MDATQKDTLADIEQIVHGIANGQESDGPSPTGIRAQPRRPCRRPALSTLVPVLRWAAASSPQSSSRSPAPSRCP